MELHKQKIKLFAIIFQVSKMIKDVSWKKENKVLDEDAETNIQLKKQINKQTDMDSLIQNSINDKIYDLKIEATVLTKNLQNQKYKNLELQTIIKHIRYKLDQDKKIQASVSNDINFQNIQSLQRKIKKLQYDLDQTNSRSNKIAAKVTEQKNKISILRTQRVIDSSIFRNIQKQLIQEEMDFKKLLIDKIKNQKQYEQTLKEYNSLKVKAQHVFQISQKVSREKSGEAIQLLEIQESINPNNKFKEVGRLHSQYRQTFNLADQQKQQKAQWCQFLVKKLLIDVGVKNTKEVIYFMNNLEQINDSYYIKLNQEADQANKIQRFLKQGQCIKSSSQKVFYKAKSEPTKCQKRYAKCQQLKSQINQVKFSTTNQIRQISSLFESKEFYSILSKFNIKKQNILNQEVDLQEFSSTLKKIQSQLMGLNYHQIPQPQQKQIKTGRSDRTQEKLQDVMQRMKRYDQSDKIMKRQEFKQEYKKIMQNVNNGLSRNNLKKKTTQKKIHLKKQLNGTNEF